MFFITKIILSPKGVLGINSDVSLVLSESWSILGPKLASDFLTAEKGIRPRQFTKIQMISSFSSKMLTGIEEIMVKKKLKNTTLSAIIGA